jgi:hypothetical protein
MDYADDGSPALEGAVLIRGAANLHLYHYTANSPVKFTDPDGRYLGLKNAHSNFKQAISRARNVFLDNNLSQLTEFDMANAIRSITRDSWIEGARTLQLNDEELGDYSQGEISRYGAFAEVRGKDALTYGAADAAMSAAEFRFKRAENEALHSGKSGTESRRYAENEANKILDDFINSYNPDYIPPEPIDVK